MSITTIERSFASAEGPIIGGDYSRKYKRSYNVLADSAITEAELLALAGVSLPAYGTVHPSDPLAYCDGFSPRLDPNDETLAVVECTWSTKTRDGKDPSEQQKLPTQRKPKVQWSFSEEAEYPLADLTGKPFLNSADVRWENGTPILRDRFTLVITKNYSSVNIGDLQQQHNTINNSAFLGFAQYSLRCRVTAGEIQWEDNERFYPITRELIWRPDLWKPYKRLNEGTYQLDATGALVPCTDKFGSPVTIPVPLAADGVQLTGAEIDAGLISYEEFDIFYETDFATFVPIDWY